MCVAGMGEVVQPTLIAVLLVGCRRFMVAQLWILDTAMTMDESLQSQCFLIAVVASACAEILLKMVQ